MLAALGALGCSGAQPRLVRSTALRAAPLATPGAARAALWQLTAVGLLREDARARFVDGGDGVPRWLFGPLRVVLDGDQPVVVGEATRAPIVAATRLDEASGWLFVTEDGAAWTARAFDAALRRAPSEAAGRVRALSDRSFGAIAVETADHSVFFASAAGLVRAPDTLAEPVIAAAFSDADRAWIIEQPGRVLEARDRGRSITARPLGDGEAALELFVTPGEVLVRTGRGWRALDPQLQRWVARPAPITATPSLGAADVANALAVSAALEPTRGRALALSLGAVALSDRSLALIDRGAGGELVFVKADGSTRRVEAPCEQGTLHPFGERLVVECGDESTQMARYYLGDERGFRAITDSPAPADSVHIAPDGTGIVIERSCRAGPDRDDGDATRTAVACVFDHGHSARSMLIDPDTRVRAVRAGRVLLEPNSSTRAAPEFRVANLRSLHESIAVEGDWAWRDPTLAADGAVVATVPLGRGFALARWTAGAPAERYALPPRATQAFSVDATRAVALARAPAAAWISEDRGRTWTALALGVDGASSVSATSAGRYTRSTASVLGRAAADINGTCAAYACALDDGLVLASADWLRAAPIAAARLAPDASETQPLAERRGPVEQVWFCGNVEPRTHSINGLVRTATSAPSDPWGGAPGARGWLAVDERGASVRVRWISVELGRPAQRASAFSPIAAIATSASSPRTASPSPVDWHLRLATDTYAVLERCTAADECDVLWAPAGGAPRVIAAPDELLASSHWRAKVQLVEPTADRGFALWIAREESSRNGALLWTDRGGADVVLAFDRAGRLLAQRSFAWAEDQCSMRALAFDGDSLGVACARDDRPTHLRFFALSGAPERRIDAAFDREPLVGCEERADMRAWMVTGTPGWAPLVYARGRPLAFEFGVRARWSLRDAGPCLTELRVDARAPNPGAALQRALDASVRVASSRADAGRLHADFIGPSAIQRASCTQR